MFKSARWRSEKNKIKALFKLQFHATQVSQVVGDALMVSVVPADVGKPTVKSDKATIRDGNCYWENAVFETVKFVQDPKSGKFHERIYYFVVATGSSKSGLVGEASIDFSSYADATKVSLVSLPLKSSKSEAVLHVSIQRIQDSADQSVVQEIEDAKLNSQDRSLRSRLSNGDFEAILNDNSIEDVTANKPTSQNGVKNGNSLASSESDITLSSSGSSSEQINFSSSLSLALVPHKSNTNVSTTVHEEIPNARWEWMGPASETDVEKLKSELLAMARQVDVSDLELQTLRKQIVKESKRGHDLSKEVSSLKEEREALKEELDRLISSQRRREDTKSKDKLLYENGDIQALVDELRQELNYHKDLNANLQIQLQKTQESNSELILAVRDLDEMLEQKDRDIVDVSSNKAAVACDDAEKFPDVISNLKNETSDEDDEEQKALEQLVREHTDAKETYVLERKITDLHGEIEMYRRDRDELEMQMEQLALDYEILKQQNHDTLYKLEQSEITEQLKIQYECSDPYATVGQLEVQIETLENELKKQSEELSDSLVTISELEAQVRNLEEELEKKAQADTSVRRLEAQVRNMEEELDKKAQVENCLGQLEAQVRNLEDKLDKNAAQFETSVGQLEAQIDTLENELKKQSEEFSNSLVMISELEAQVRTLEEELEKQVEGFEADLSELSREKVEQEQRAIRAEEALRKTRWQNASTAERLQEEFKRLSTQMASTFEANEKLASKALNEANEFRLQKLHLEDLLQSTRDHYEATVLELSGEVEKLQTEIEEKSVQIERQEELAKESQLHLSQKIIILEAEIENLLAEKKYFSDHEAEFDKVRMSLKDKELLVEQGQNERSELEMKLVSSRKEAEESLKELNNMKSLKEENEKLHLEVSNLKSRCNDMKKMLFEDEVEKEKLKKQVSVLDKKLKDARLIASNGTKATSKNNKSTPSSPGSREVSSLKEKIKLLEGQIKLKESALESSTNSFLEKERDLQHKIEELERRLEELNLNAVRLSEKESQKVAAENEASASNTRDFEKLSNEIRVLRERNMEMDEELKEMQERYSEISLKFAEVEGERQKLVMKLRNSKKNP